MMKRLPLANYAALVLALGSLPFAGCDKKDSPASNTPPSQKSEESPKAAAASHPTANPAMRAAAEANSFDEVAARLDHGGALYFYLSTEQWLSALSQQLTKWQGIAQAAADKQDPATVEQMNRAFSIATDLVKKSGLEDITGLGASSFAIERGVYRNKMFVHHYPGKGNGFLWSMLGKAPHRLTALDILPTDTAAAGFMDFDLLQLVNTLRQVVEQAGIPEAKMALDQGLLQFTAMTGMSLDELLQSLGGGVGLVVTLDPDKPISVPVGEKTESIPAPRLALVFQVKNDRIFQQIDKALGAAPNILRVDEANLRMRTMAVPALPTMEVRATAAQWGEYLVLASDDKLVRDMIAAQSTGKGFKSTPEFARLSAGLPEEGNGFQMATQRFADTWNRFQSEMMKNQPGVSAEQLAMIQKLFGENKAGSTYSVTGHVENGWLATSKGSQGAGQIIAPLVVFPAAVIAGAALPVFGKVQEKGKATKSLSNAKQIATACRLYAVDNNGKFPPTLQALIPDYLPDGQVFVSPFATGEPIGYAYTAGLTDSSPATAELLTDKFSEKEGQRVVVRVDTSGQVIPIKK